MKLLIDTCIWSLALRRKASATLSKEEQEAVTTLTLAIQDRRAAIIGPVRQEIVSGISDPVRFERIQEALSAFQDEVPTSADFEEAARLSNLCRSRGIASGPVDILICAVAKRRQWQILTADQGLQRCIEILE
jgi:predicted nucleic acid-binding protein